MARSGCPNRAFFIVAANNRLSQPGTVSYPRHRRQAALRRILRQPEPPGGAGRRMTRLPGIFLSSELSTKDFCMPATVNSHLADSLFRQVFPARQQTTPGQDVQQAILNAKRRWPEMARMIDAAVTLVEGDSLCEMAGEPAVLGLCRPEATGRGSLVSQSATGLSCTCDDWPPAVRAGPGDGLYCPHILALLLQVYLRRPLRPLPYSPETLWQQALDELRRLVTRAAFTSWLAGSRVVPAASTPLQLTVEVPTPYAQEWLAYRLQPVIAQTLAGIAGYPLDIHFVSTSMRSNC